MFRYLKLKSWRNLFILVVFAKNTLKGNFPGGNDGGLQAHPLKTLTDGRIIKFGGPGPVAVAPMIVSQAYLGVRFLKYQFNLLKMHCKTFILFDL